MRNEKALLRENASSVATALISAISTLFEVLKAHLGARGLARIFLDGEVQVRNERRERRAECKGLAI